MCGGKEAQGCRYSVGSARGLIQWSPNHGASTSGFAEIDLDQRPQVAMLETLNQRVRGSSP